MQAMRSIPVPALQAWKEVGRHIRRPTAFMKQRLFVCLALILVVALGLCSTALAESIIVPEVNVMVSENRFSGPQPVDVTVTVTNKADVDMPGPCALYDPAGVRITEFGQPTLKAGESAVWSGTWNVTEAQLTDGRLTFVLAYTYRNDAGVLETKTQPYSVSIVNAGAEAKIEVDRSITPTTARNGQKVYVTYTIRNTGRVDVTDLTIKESSAIASSAAKLGALKAGETVTHTFTVTMGKKSLTSRATVTWKASGKEGSASVADATIKYGDVKLTASVSADKKGGPMGDVVKLTITLKNTGKTAIGNITVEDPILGTIFSGQTVEGNNTLTLEKELTITSTADHIFTITGTNASGDVIQTATEYVNIIAVDPAKAANLTVIAEADRSTIYTKPGIVKFTVHVTNNSTVEATNVTVSASGVTVYPYNTSSSGVAIAPGETLTFVRDVQVDYPGTFRFDAHTTDQLGEKVTFEGNGVVVRYAPPTATPTLAPIATPQVPVTQPVPQQDNLPAYYDTAESALDIGFWVMAGLAALCLVLIVVGVVGRSASASKAAQAEDNIMRSANGDYTRAVSNRRRRYMPESETEDEPVARPAPEEPAEAPADAPADDAVADMQETMSELYPEVTPAADEPAPEAPAEEPTEVTYRRRRRVQQDD